MADKKYCIYMLTSPSGKSYIGQTNNLQRRLIEHQKRNGCRAIHLAINKYGFDNIIKNILASNLTLKEANLLEAKFIDKHNTICPHGYNLTTGGDHSSPSKESRKKMSLAAIGRKFSESTLEKMSEAKKGIYKDRVVTEDHKNKLSEAAKKRYSDPEQRKKASELSKGRKLSDETKNKISKSKTGKKQSDASIEKRSKSLKIAFSTDKAKEKLRQRNKKRYEDPEQREKLSKSLVKRFSTEESRLKHSKACKAAHQRRKACQHL